VTVSASGTLQTLMQVLSISVLRGEAGHPRSALWCPLMTQSGHSARQVPRIVTARATSKKGVQSVGLIEYQKRVFRAVPGGKNGTLSGHISARREALAMRVMWSLDNYQPRIMLQF
jgi:hypothetical protein